MIFCTLCLGGIEIFEPVHTCDKESLHKQTGGVDFTDEAHSEDRQ